MGPTVKMCLLKCKPTSVDIILKDITQKEADIRMIIHTPDMDGVVLAVSFSRDIDSNILVKTRLKSKLKESIEIIFGKLVKRFSQGNISSATKA